MISLAKIIPVWTRYIIEWMYIHRLLSGIYSKRKKGKTTRDARHMSERWQGKAESEFCMRLWMEKMVSKKE